MIERKLSPIAVLIPTAVLIPLALLAIACSPAGSGGKSKKCDTPGEIETCGCVNGQGQKVCGDDKKWDKCQCPEATTGETTTGETTTGETTTGETTTGETTTGTPTEGGATEGSTGETTEGGTTEGETTEGTTDHVGVGEGTEGGSTEGSTGETTEGGTTEGSTTGGVEDTSCASVKDQAEIKNPATIMEAMGCIQGGAARSVECILETTELSEACAPCFVEVAQCVAGDCLDSCVSGPESCTGCAYETGCGQNYEKCAGVPLDFGQTECVANCAGKQCGTDGCGGSCGSCNETDTCQAGACVPNECTPSCPEDGTCGASDGCGGTCGCPVAGQLCEAGVCVNSGDCAGGITYEGCCAGDTVTFCAGDAVSEIECEAGTCGWKPDVMIYDCGTEGAEDPSGQNPKACPAD